MLLKGSFLIKDDFLVLARFENVKIHFRATWKVFCVLWVSLLNFVVFILHLLRFIHQYRRDVVAASNSFSGLFVVDHRWIGQVVLERPAKQLRLLHLWATLVDPRVQRAEVGGRLRQTLNVYHVLSNFKWNFLLLIFILLVFKHQYCLDVVAASNSFSGLVAVDHRWIGQAALERPAKQLRLLHLWAKIVDPRVRRAEVGGRLRQTLGASCPSLLAFLWMRLERTQDRNICRGLDREEPAKTVFIIKVS